MEILEVSATEYAKVIEVPFHLFGSALFNDLNKKRCEEVIYLLFREGKYRLGIIGGTRDNIFHSPFSAPFGGFSYISPNIRLQYIEEAIKSLIHWATERKMSSINITLPPSIYDSSFTAKQNNCLWRGGFEIAQVDLNYSFDLGDFDEDYTERIWYNARKNLRIAMKAGLQFFTCTAESEKLQAYDIIRKNRESRGFPLRMSWQLVADTTRIIPSDFFMVRDQYDNAIASAIVFHVAQNIVQVIYWGDILEYKKLKTMNFLAFKVFEHYKNKGIQIVDLGPSTETSEPNYGLAEFKESIGCGINPKYTFARILN